MRYKSLGFRDFGAGTEAVGHATRTEQGLRKRQEARGKRQEGKKNVYLIAMINAIFQSRADLEIY
ncbi:hypothetical protein BJP34_14320 [Moorena producens PAL-8-15-08-1]|uniref:Uncharacterized protein n=1 Tax=Moorena producens PAL-8-15-08-1 TaxID=1458985 RepID=A0A1D8TSE3_9CYAN|nr:hypothetical protein BJP34_14320 [Moorena producens PAL-8-15-08-1]